jgi:hypothetical protein
VCAGGGSEGAPRSFCGDPMGRVWRGDVCLCVSSVRRVFVRIRVRVVCRLCALTIIVK